MKYLIVITDGAADNPMESIGNKTPLEVAYMPYTNMLASKGKVGLVSTIPDGIPPGSDAANLSIMGYDPSIYLTGRSPIEAVSIGIELEPTDVAFRANFVTLEGTGDYDDLIVKDHSAGDISTEDADILIQAVKAKFDSDKLSFHTGTGYRHCMVVPNGKTHYECTPPHDILDQKTGNYLPKGEGAEFITKMMRESYEILNDHPINIKRAEKGLNKANSLWIWGQGKKPNLDPISSKYGITGSVISAVDLIKGIGIFAGLDSIDVVGATGNVHTNYKAKADAALNEFKKGKDFVYLHFEGPDECSHQGDLDGKLQCLKDIDEKAVKYIIEDFNSRNESIRILIAPDHRTPLVTRTHSSDPVPYVIYQNDAETTVDESKKYNETAGEKGEFFSDGYLLTNFFFG